MAVKRLTTKQARARKALLFTAFVGCNLALFFVPFVVGFVWMAAGTGLKQAAGLACGLLSAEGAAWAFLLWIGVLLEVKTAFPVWILWFGCIWGASSLWGRLRAGRSDLE